jgi:hypothetical protein
VLCVAFNPFGSTADDILVTCGARNINFWKLEASKGGSARLEKKSGVFSGLGALVKLFRVALELSFCRFSSSVPLPLSQV